MRLRRRPPIYTGRNAISRRFGVMLPFTPGGGIPAHWDGLVGKSTFRETHDLSVGTMGIIGQKIANEMIMKSDVILAVGTCLAPENTKMLSPEFINPQKQKIIQIDIEALNTGWAYPVAMGVQSDAKLALQEIIACLRKKPVIPDVEQRIDEIKQKKTETAFFSDPAVPGNSAPITSTSTV